MAFGIGSMLLNQATPKIVERMPTSPSPRLPIPDRLVVLTFDDGTKSDIACASPILKRYGFGASFYVTEGLREIKCDDDALTWQDIRKLDADGFEIGNHTKNHVDVSKLPPQEFVAELEGIEKRCEEYGVTIPTTFVYPGFQDSVQAAQVLFHRGYLFARRGVIPEFRDGNRGARGPVYDPRKQHPLLIPTTGYAGPEWNLRDLEWAVDQAKDGRIAVLAFHGIPYPRAPWVSTQPEVFESYMKYLSDRRCSVIALRDLRRYVATAPSTKVPLRRARGGFKFRYIGSKPLAKSNCDTQLYP
jgi:peptidoglycan/xylan/chitin deacetylase (PgdA/CDA1 family)